MTAKADPKRVEKFLKENNYLDVYIFLITSLDNITNRAILLDKDIKKFEEKIRETVKKVDENLDEIVPDNPEISRMFKDIHYIELEIIQRINILIELLAVYYHMTRTDLKKLPKCIGIKDFPPKEMHNEFKYFKQQNLNDVWTNFKYPNVKYFTELSVVEQNTLEQLLKESTQKILESFKEIDQFRRHFRAIYIKYKHTLSEFTGIFGIDKNNRQIQTHIYLRDEKKGKVSTYMIQVSLDAVRYFDEIATRVYNLLRVLIDNTLLYIVNEEKNFIPRTLFIDRKNEMNFKMIVEKIQSCIMPNFISKVIVKPPDSKNIDKVNQQLLKDHIYQMNKDILDLKELLKDDISFSKS